MHIISIKLNCSTKAEYYRILGILMVVQKLLNDYMSHAGEEGVGPEGFAEEWMNKFGLDSLVKEQVLSMFNGTLLVISRRERNE